MIHACLPVPVLRIKLLTCIDDHNQIPLRWESYVANKAKFDVGLDDHESKLVKR